MGGVVAGELARGGYELGERLVAALPMPVWALDLEVEAERAVSAAEQAVLRLTDAGVFGLDELARSMGLGDDRRLPERVLVRLLGAGAVVVEGRGFAVTAVGRRWLAEGTSVGRERVTAEVRLDPSRDVLEWVDHERPLVASKQTWTIELPSVDDAALLRRKPALAALVRDAGLPDEDERGPQRQRPRVELRGVAVVSRRVHWREVQIDVWRHPMRADDRIVGHVDHAEHPPLTRLLSTMVLARSRRRCVTPAAAT